MRGDCRRGRARPRPCPCNGLGAQAPPWITPPAGAHAIQHRQKLGWIRALGVIGVHFRIGDDTVGADHVAGRHWQHPRRIVVHDRQVVAESLVDFHQVVWQREADAESIGDLAFDIAAPLHSCARCLCEDRTAAQLESGPFRYHLDSAQVISLDAPSRLKIDGLPGSATENSTPFFSGAGHRALMHDVTRFMEVHNQSLSVAFPIFISACVRTLGW